MDIISIGLLSRRMRIKDIRLHAQSVGAFPFSSCKSRFEVERWAVEIKKARDKLSDKSKKEQMKELKNN